MREYGFISLAVAIMFIVIEIFSSTPVYADPSLAWNFTKIVDTSTAIPGGTGNFTSVSVPSLEGDDLVFYGSGIGDQRGIYTFIGGVLSVMADTNTPIPGGMGNFKSPCSPTIDDGTVVFNDYYQGIYISTGGTLNTVADTNTPIPSGTGTFEWLAVPDMDGGIVVFHGNDQVSQAGIYTFKGGALSVIADTNTPIPGQAENFNAFGTYPSIDSENVTFKGFYRSWKKGIYTHIDEALNVIVDTNTPVPGGTGNFTDFNGYTPTDDGNVAFHGIGIDGQEGIYISTDGALSIVANTNTPIPGGTGTFTHFGSFPSMDDGNIVFRGIGSDGQMGIYANIGGELLAIIDLNSMLDGKNLSGVWSPDLRENTVVFDAHFTDGTETIYRADLVQEQIGPVSLNGVALVADQFTQTTGRSKKLGYLADGEAFAFEEGDVFSFAPVQLHHGKTIKSLRCVMKDNTTEGYIRAHLMRGPINTVDPVVGPSRVIGSVATKPDEAATDFIERLSNVNPALGKIDNTKYGYFLRVDFKDNPGRKGREITLGIRGCVGRKDWGITLGIRGCVIEYTE